MSASYDPRAPAPPGYIPLSVPHCGGNEWKYVKECLDTAWISSAGPFVDRFERMIAEYVGSNFAVATINGTAALHTALMVMGVKRDDEVLTSTLTFIAPANAIRYVGAWPVFIDAEPNFWQMDLQKLIDFLRNSCQRVSGNVINKTTGRRVRAILPVHILGHPCEMNTLKSISQEYQLPIIEDATEALGATFQGLMAGTIGDIGCFSFNGNKLLTTAGGGMIVTNNEELAGRARYLTTQAKDDSVEFVHGEIGYNYRLSNVHAAIGCAQLEQISEFIERKRRIAANYSNAFSTIPGITTMRESGMVRSVYWMYTVLVDSGLFGMDSRRLLKYLESERIQTRPLWQPIHLSKAHADGQATDCSVAEFLNKSALSLPCSVGLSTSDQARVVECIQAACRIVTRSN